MKAVMLVGGEGTRLRPLTYYTPKPMVPILNRPFLEHVFAYLKHYGVDDIILTLNYLPQAVQDYFGDGSKLRVKLTYVVEDSPLGTAGAIKNVEQHLDSTFVVLNGDTFTDLDIADMLACHRRNRARASIALNWVDNPCAFGVVETGTDNRVGNSPPPIITAYPIEGAYNILRQTAYVKGLQPNIFPQSRKITLYDAMFIHRCHNRRTSTGSSTGDGQNRLLSSNMIRCIW